MENSSLGHRAPGLAIQWFHVTQNPGFFPWIICSWWWWKRDSKDHVPSQKVAQISTSLVALTCGSHVIHHTAGTEDCPISDYRSPRGSFRCGWTLDSSFILRASVTSKPVMPRASAMTRDRQALWGQAFTAKPHDMSSLLRIHMLQRELSIPTGSSLIYICVHWLTWTWTQAHTHTHR